MGPAWVVPETNQKWYIPATWREDTDKLSISGCINRIE